MNIEQEAMREDISVDIPEHEVVIPPEGVGLGIDLSFLGQPTGPGDVDDYINHVMNFNKSTWLARIIRGLTGLIGNLNYAILDIAMGFIEMINAKKGAVPGEKVN